MEAERFVFVNLVMSVDQLALMSPTLLQGTDRDISIEDWDLIMRTNVVGFAKCTEHAVALMRENEVGNLMYNNDQGEGVTKIHAGSRGSIVNIASVSSFIAQPEFVPYNASKGAVLQLTKCAAMDLAPFKIRDNA